MVTASCGGASNPSAPDGSREADDLIETVVVRGEQFGSEAPVDSKAAAELLESIVPAVDWERFASPGAPRALTFNGVVYGKLWSIQRSIEVLFLVESPRAIRLRHKIVVGTDLRDWKILRVEKSGPTEPTFSRVYVLTDPEPQGRDPAEPMLDGGLRGLVFHEGAMLELRPRAGLTPGQRQAFTKMVWKAADALGRVYREHIQEIAEGPRFDHPVPERPDLPDPDARTR